MKHEQHKHTHSTPRFVEPPSSPGQNAAFNSRSARNKSPTFAWQRHPIQHEQTSPQTYIYYTPHPNNVRATHHKKSAADFSLSQFVQLNLGSRKGDEKVLRRAFIRSAKTACGERFATVQEDLRSTPLRACGGAGSYSG